MRRSTFHVPRPPDYIPVRFVVQDSFLGLGELDANTDYARLADAINDSVRSVCHRFGIWVSVVEIIYHGRGYQVVARLGAGTWSEELKVTAKKWSAVNRTLCSGILRLAERDHEFLG